MDSPLTLLWGLIWPDSARHRSFSIPCTQNTWSAPSREAGSTTATKVVLQETHYAVARRSHVTNGVTFLERTGPWRRPLREAEYGSLERDRDFLETISPIHQVARITAPLFVLHGANDARVPVSEAEQMVAALRDRGRPVESLIFADEGHQFTKRSTQLVAYPAVARFLARHLGTNAEEQGGMAEGGETSSTAG